MAIELENLTEALQRHLGVQQAQTVIAENITADAIARLTGARGDAARLFALWSDDAADLVEGYDAAEHGSVLRSLQQVLAAGVVVQRYANGAPKAFLPLAPELVTHKKTNTIFRELGRSVDDNLWVGSEIRDAIRTRIEGWIGRHPLAQVLVPLCKRVKDESKSEAGRLREASARDPQLSSWLAGVVTQDWRAWLRATESLSVDEQIETMTALIGLHLHVGLLWRLRDPSRPSVAPCTFVALAGHGMDQACARGAYNCYAFWGDRSTAALREVALAAITSAAKEDPILTEGLEGTAWKRAGPWTLVNIRGQRSTATNVFRESLRAAVEKGEASGREPAPGEVREIIVESLVRAFSGDSGVASKVKDYLRTSGRAVGLVGPDEAYARKRYQLDERGLNLLARLHVVRTMEEVASDEEEKNSIEAFLDDLFHRYGIVITRERDRIRQRLETDAVALRPLLKHFPDEEPMRRNRAQLDRRLDELRFVRRYSDASAVLHIG